MAAKEKEENDYLLQFQVASTRILAEEKEQF